MANAQAPYFNDGKWWIDVDQDDINYIVADITQDLTDRATTVLSVDLDPTCVTVLEGPDAQGSLIVVKVTMAPLEGVIPHLTFRVNCANTEQFDRTVWFNLEEH